MIEKSAAAKFGTLVVWYVAVNPMHIMERMPAYSIEPASSGSINYRMPFSTPSSTVKYVAIRASVQKI